MKKFNLQGVSEILSEKELKNVTGGCTPSHNCGSGTFGCYKNGAFLGCKSTVGECTGAAGY